ncbi:MAG: biotin synthase BioB [Anaeromicrobium sp.]|jgi:biotin synthase|uniref:biotin synthase BioB n=1 Tax=Anaeromicrobium sp. TaxID=1929132 RepID=UPI0025EFFF76|nr:biotin synthase BioB [Anaeromicrobium sp.]MCT4595739.1 biotin synthase BioB [Anaeromicrobium sp.]
MRDFILGLKEMILDGGEITREEALKLANIQDEETCTVLFESANEIRENLVGDRVDLCTIMNVKSGKCSEDCRYCAQSSHYKTGVETYSLLDSDKIIERAKEMESEGVDRFSLVSSGRDIKEDLEGLLEIYDKLVGSTDLHICASHGILKEEDAKKLKEKGVIRYHHNLETSREYYKEICTTHTYEDRIETIKNVQKTGMEVCCGGIFGMGESQEDRIDMAFEIKNLGIKSVPINILNPVKGTPMEENYILLPVEILKIIALYRFILPDATIRYAGGRKALGEKDKDGFLSGVNGALTGNYLTTTGKNVSEDIEMIKSVGLKLNKR